MAFSNTLEQLKQEDETLCNLSPHYLFLHLFLQRASGLDGAYVSHLHFSAYIYLSWSCTHHHCYCYTCCVGKKDQSLSLSAQHLGFERCRLFLMVWFVSAAELLQPIPIAAAAAARCGPASPAHLSPLLCGSAGSRELTGQKAHSTKT